MRTIRACALAVTVLALAGCGDGDGDAPGADTNGAPSAGAVLPGGGLTVAEAIATEAEPPLAVTGWVVRSDDGARLCSSYDATADEPCGEPSLALEGEVEQGTGEQASLLGAVRDGTLAVSSTDR